MEFLTEDSTLAIGSERLVATRVLADSAALPRVISFHGTGAGTDRHRVRYMLDYLATKKISSACFDFSGHGDSTGSMERATLELRLAEARYAFSTLIGETRPCAIIGSSMGGYLAASLSPVLKPDALILICPAAYPDSALKCRFGEDFFPVTRAPGAYFGSPAFQALAGFKGKLLIIGARQDTVIPMPVPELYYESAIGASSRKIIWLEDSDHFIHPWLAEHETDRRAIFPEILATLAA